MQVGGAPHRLARCLATASGGSTLQGTGGVFTGHVRPPQLGNTAQPLRTPPLGSAWLEPQEGSQGGMASASPPIPTTAWRASRRSRRQGAAAVAPAASAPARRIRPTRVPRGDSPWWYVQQPSAPALAIGPASTRGPLCGCTSATSRRPAGWSAPHAARASAYTPTEELRWKRDPLGERARSYRGLSVFV